MAIRSRPPLTRSGRECLRTYKVSDAVALDGKVAYDYQFRNQDWNKGIVWGGLRLRYHF